MNRIDATGARPVVRPAAPQAPAPAPAPAPRLAADQAPPARLVETEGVGGSLLRFVPSPLRWVGLAGLAALDGAVDWVKDKLGAGPTAPAPRDGGARSRAEAVWGTIEQRYGIPGVPGAFTETGGRMPATVWPHGQAIAACLATAELTGDWSKVDATMRRLDDYETNGAYAPGTFTWGAKRLWDDNAWIGLDFLQAHAQTGNADYVAAAEKIFPFMKDGLHQDGGIYWEERNDHMTRNTCANAPAIAYALKLYRVTGKPEYRAFAENCHQMMTKQLRSPEGLYYDHVGDDGKLDKTFYSYNQGAAIGAEIEMYRVTGDPACLARARQTADAAIKHFSKDDGFWKGSPAFNAIFFRNLLVLDTLAPDPRYRQLTQAYVDRVWKEGRDPATGALDRGGIGGYDPRGLLDQSGFAQLNALLGWPKARLALVA